VPIYSTYNKNFGGGTDSEEGRGKGATRTELARKKQATVIFAKLGRKLNHGKGEDYSQYGEIGKITFRRKGT